MQPNQPSLFEVLTGHVAPEDGIYATSYNNLFLIPADRGLFNVSEFLSSSGTGAFILKLRLKSIANLFDYVLIDVQPSRSQLCLTAVGASDDVVIPVEANVKGVNSLSDSASVDTSISGYQKTKKPKSQAMKTPKAEPSLQTKQSTMRLEQELSDRLQNVCRQNCKPETSEVNDGQIWTIIHANPNLGQNQRNHSPQ